MTTSETKWTDGKMTVTANSAAWNEYDSAADYLAARGLTTISVDSMFTSLPDGMSAVAVGLITEDPDAFMRHVRAFAYARAMQNADAESGIE